jgi:hypothetical protein
MVTKEQLLARRAQLEQDLIAQQELANAAEGRRQEAVATLAKTRDLTNALSGAKQDVEFWLRQIDKAAAAEQPAPQPDPPASEQPATKEPLH